MKNSITNVRRIEMQFKRRTSKSLQVMLCLAFFMSIHSTAFAELTLESVYPTLGEMGEDLEVTLTGTGFDENTRVSMSLDAVNKGAIIGSVDTPGSAEGVAIADGKAYVADGNGGFVIVPIPVEISPITVDNPTRISLSLPSPQMAGYYNLRAFNDNESDTLIGAITFQSGDQPGDVNGDGVAKLEDAIVALKALAGMDSAGLIRSDYIASGADVNGDNKIGLAEILYIMRGVADGVASPDNDGDGVADGEDNCPLDANLDQLDTDGDDEGNVCDTDDDGDDIDDAEDNCPLDANSDQLDTDDDGEGDVCDADYVSWYIATDSAEWSPRADHATVTFDGKMWVLGGNTDPPSSDVWFSSDGSQWFQATEKAPWTARDSFASVVFEGRIWVIGGRRMEGRSDDDPMSDVLNDVWYSSDGENWTLATEEAQWSRRAGHSSVVFDNKIWLIGGYEIVEQEDRNGNPHYLLGMKNDVWYSEDGVNWTQATDSASWSERARHTSVVYDGRMWIIGGYEYQLPSMTPPLQFIETYGDVWSSTDGIIWGEIHQEETETWRGEYGRTHHRSLIFDDEMWIIGGQWVVGTGGHTSGLYSDVWASSDGAHWTQLIENPGWSPRTRFSCTVFDSKVWVMGGLKWVEVDRVTNAIPDNVVWFYGVNKSNSSAID